MLLRKGMVNKACPSRNRLALSSLTVDGDIDQITKQIAKNIIYLQSQIDSTR
jgi:hypothetical protein